MLYMNERKECGARAWCSGWQGRKGMVGLCLQVSHQLGQGADLAPVAHGFIPRDALGIDQSRLPLRLDRRLEQRSLLRARSVDPVPLRRGVLGRGGGRGRGSRGGRSGTGRRSGRRGSSGGGGRGGKAACRRRRLGRGRRRRRVASTTRQGVGVGRLQDAAELVIGRRARLGSTVQRVVQQIHVLAGRVAERAKLEKETTQRERRRQSAHLAGLAHACSLTPLFRVAFRSIRGSSRSLNSQRWHEQREKEGL